MTFKTITSRILQVTGLITALTGLVKSLLDLIEAGTPHMMMKTTARIGGPHPPAPPSGVSIQLDTPSFYDEYVFIIGPILIMVGLIVMAVAKKMRKTP